jgi:hypothetical protein
MVVGSTLETLEVGGEAMKTVGDFSAFVHFSIKIIK